MTSPAVPTPAPPQGNESSGVDAVAPWGGGRTRAFCHPDSATLLLLRCGRLALRPRGASRGSGPGEPLAGSWAVSRALDPSPGLQFLFQMLNFMVYVVSTVFCGHLGTVELAAVTLSVAVSIARTFFPGLLGEDTA